MTRLLALLLLAGCTFAPLPPIDGTLYRLVAVGGEPLPYTLADGRQVELVELWFHEGELIRADQVDGVVTQSFGRFEADPDYLLVRWDWHPSYYDAIAAFRRDGVALVLNERPPAAWRFEAVLK